MAIKTSLRALSWLHYRNVSTGLSLDLAFVVLIALPPAPSVSLRPHTPWHNSGNIDFADSLGSSLTQARIYPRSHSPSLPYAYYSTPVSSPTPVIHRRHHPAIDVPVSRRTVDLTSLSLASPLAESRSSVQLTLPDNDHTPVIHTARGRPVAFSERDLALEAELDLDDALSLVNGI
ncbi:hypothetical protein C8J55DRAFT_560663 [Lentinula edodes]|uniref:Uncharacterized protein n=1 Tax=Lentinula lateritia TaxID=40482 RepID=A0A9W9AC64_9AGAR|nr:hypothetical protein C8J55DRAFT_560663 [Lentinula edodes]